jgi:hypothetical protein
MAERFAQYIAKNLKLTPSDKGYTSAELAARRIGTAATQSADAIRRVTQLEAQEEESTGKELTTFARFRGLEQDLNTGGGVKVERNSLKDMFQLGAGGKEPNYAALNQMANGARSLGRLARNVVAAQSPVKTTAENGVTVLRGGADAQAPDANAGNEPGGGMTIIRGDQSSGGAQWYEPNDPTRDLLTGQNPGVSTESLRSQYGGVAGAPTIFPQGYSDTSNLDKAQQENVGQTTNYAPGAIGGDFTGQGTNTSITPTPLGPPSSAGTPMAPMGAPDPASQGANAGGNYATSPPVMNTNMSPQLYQDIMGGI